MWTIDSCQHLSKNISLDDFTLRLLGMCTLSGLFNFDDDDDI